MFYFEKNQSKVCFISRRKNIIEFTVKGGRNVNFLLLFDNQDKIQIFKILLHIYSTSPIIFKDRMCLFIQSQEEFRGLGYLGEIGA